VIIQTKEDMNSLFIGIWNDMNNALIAGDKERALSYVAREARPKYGPVFDALMPDMTEIVASYSEPSLVSVSERISELGVTVRDSNGKKMLYLIYFVKSGDGVWRILTM
jgi:hypothetical protein